MGIFKFLCRFMGFSRQSFNLDYAILYIPVFEFTSSMLMHSDKKCTSTVVRERWLPTSIVYSMI